MHGAEAWSQMWLLAGWVKAEVREGGSPVLASAVCYLEDNWRQMLCVLVRSGYYNKIPQPGRLKQQTFVSGSSGAWKV